MLTTDYLHKYALYVYMVCRVYCLFSPLFPIFLIDISLLLILLCILLFFPPYLLLFVILFSSPRSRHIVCHLQIPLTCSCATLPQLLNLVSPFVCVCVCVALFVSAFICILPAFSLSLFLSRYFFLFLFFFLFLSHYLFLSH